MQLSDKAVEREHAQGDRYLDLRGLANYSALSVSCLRDHIRKSGMPFFKVEGKILVKQSEFDRWVERYRGNTSEDLDKLVDEMLESIN